MVKDVGKGMTEDFINVQSRQMGQTIVLNLYFIIHNLPDANSMNFCILLLAHDCDGWVFNNIHSTKQQKYSLK